MSRFSSLCGLLIIFALFGSIVAPPGGHRSGSCSSSSCSGSHGGSSYWYGLDRYLDFGLSRATIKDFGEKVGKGVSDVGGTVGSAMRLKNKWRDVKISTVGKDKGILRATLHGTTAYYDFYRNKDCHDGHTTGVGARYSFKKKDIKSGSQDGKKVKLNVKGETVKLKFASVEDALSFNGDGNWS